MIGFRKQNSKFDAHAEPDRTMVVEAWSEAHLRSFIHNLHGPDEYPHHRVYEVVESFNPHAEDGLDFWTREEYGDFVSDAEAAERIYAVIQIMNCHKRLVDYTNIVKQTPLFMLINFACEYMLESAGKLLYLSPSEVLNNLVDVTPTIRDQRIVDYVNRVRPAAPVPAPAE